jgi:phosphate transport system permease protein
MVVFIAGGAADQATYTHNPLDASLTMTAAMASLASGTDNVAGAGLAVQSLFFVGLILFALTMGLNIIGNRFVRRMREVY